MTEREGKRERLKAMIHRFVEKKADETGKTKLEILKAIQQGLRRRIPGVN